MEEMAPSTEMEFEAVEEQEEESMLDLIQVHCHSTIPILLVEQELQPDSQEVLASKQYLPTNSIFCQDGDGKVQIQQDTIFQQSILQMPTHEFQISLKTSHQEHCF